MKFFLILLALLLVIISSCSTLNHSLCIMCYFNSRAHQTKGAEYTVDDINSTLCTHLVYQHAVVELSKINDEIRVQHPSGIFYNKDYDKLVVALKRKNPQMKVMITLHISDDLRTTAVNNKTKMNTLIQKIVDFVSRYQFDGIDLELGYSWTYTKPVNLMEALRQAFEPNGYMLSVVGRVKSFDVDFIDKSEISRLSQAVDFLHLKTYEITLPVTLQRPQYAEHHAPLYHLPWNSNDKDNNVNSVVNSWISKGFKANKIVVGIPLFGIGWTLSSNLIIPSSPANGPGALHGQAINKNGYSAYYEICRDVLNNKGWEVFPDSEQRMGPYAVSPHHNPNNRTISRWTSGRTWIGYDDPAMAIVKSKYIISKNLGGVAVSDIRLDDSRNICGTGRNPIMTAIYNTLKDWLPNSGNESVLTTTPENPTATLNFRTKTSLPIFSSNFSTIKIALSGTTPTIAAETSTEATKIEERNRHRCDIAFAFGLITSLSYLITIFYILFKVFFVCNLESRVECAPPV